MAFLPLPSPLSPGSFLLAKPGSIPSAATAAARSADAARLWEVLLQKAPPSPVVEVLLLGSWGSVHGVYFYLHWNAARSRRESTEMSWKWKHFSVRFNVPFWLRIAGAHVACSDESFKDPIHYCCCCEFHLYNNTSFNTALYKVSCLSVPGQRCLHCFGECSSGWWVVNSRCWQLYQWVWWPVPFVLLLSVVSTKKKQPQNMNTPLCA